ncbi:5-methylcytosine restriction system specificity protein McrC [Empedobacter sp.]|uniref:McrC family protein n=1 Tax=Empedobacter sp. TaxID=1927715 RepID=UPI0028B022F6|nr:restriction endonuclease [Empedobacter sp.]
MSRSFKVFEYEKITIKKDIFNRYLTKKELDKLYEFNDTNNNKYFVPIRDGIKFCNYVGVIQIGQLTIEILPKIDNNSNNINDYNIWHSALLDMLKYCKYISIDSVSEASLKKRHNSILDIYFELFVSEIEKLVHKGLIKKYRPIEGNLKNFKGKIEFSKQIRYNLIHQERVYTKHQTFDYENLINQILLYALKILKGITFDEDLLNRIKKLEYNFPEIKSFRISSNHFEKIQIDRKNITYQKAINVAKIIILNYSPDITIGRENMLTILFDMNKLWEEYIFRILKRLQNDNLIISRQEKDKFWEKREIKPDILIKHIVGENIQQYIIDTKWKIIKKNKPSDDDLKQMYVYNLYFDSYKSLLLYPNSELQSENFGSFWKGRSNPEQNQCKVGFINVLNEKGKLDFYIGEKIWNKLII